MRRVSRPLARCLCSSAAGPSVAVIGGGPAGFYLAGSLLRQAPTASLTLLEREPVPFGLVRYGVAPDHPEVKNCTRQFEAYVERAGPRFAYRGNVEVGKAVSLAELSAAFDAVVVTSGVGLSGEGKRLGLVREAELSTTAAAFVRWYNGHPEGVGLNPPLAETETVVVAGAGNVALDIARLLLSPIHSLAQTDITEEALEVFRKSRVRKVVILARRGPKDVAFTIKEFRELLRLPNQANPPEVGGPEDFEGLEPSNLPRPRRRLGELLLKSHREGLAEEGASRAGVEWRLGFNREIRSLVPDAGGRLSSVVAAVRGTETLETIGAQMLITSLGYAQTAPPGLPWDEEAGIVQTDEADGFSVPGLDNVYACGWAARGPRGVIATTQSEAKAAADFITAKLSQHSTGECNGGRSALDSLLRERGLGWSDWSGWGRMEAVEVSRGGERGKPREKITSRKEMMDIARR